MATVSNIKTVQSISSENASTVVLEFDQTANMDAVTIEMRESLDQIQGFWPDAVSNPIIMKLNPDMMPVLITAVSAKGQDAGSASQLIQDEVIPEIESVEGVAFGWSIRKCRRNGGGNPSRRADYTIKC